GLAELRRDRIRGGEPGERARADRARLGRRADVGRAHRRRDRLRRPAHGAAAQRHRDRNRPQAVVKSRRGLGAFPSPACGGGTGRGHAKRLMRASSPPPHPPPPPPPAASGGGGRPSSPVALILLPTRAPRVSTPRHLSTISDMRASPRASAKLAGCFATRALKWGNHRRTITSPSPCTHAATTSSVSSQVR